MTTSAKDILKKRVAGKYLDRLTALDNPKLQRFVADDIVALYEHIKQAGTYNVKLEFADDLKVSVSVVVVPEGVDAEAFKAAQLEAAKKSAVEEEPEPAPEASEAKEEKPQQ